MTYHAWLVNELPINQDCQNLIKQHMNIIVDYKWIDYPLKNGYVAYSYPFLSTWFSKKLFDSLSMLDFKQSEMRIYNKKVLTPRLQTWMGDSDVNASIYTKLHPNPWSEEMLLLKYTLETLTHFKFNYVLINYYRDGDDYISYHSDKESIGEGKNVICSISLGATRQFVLKHRDKTIPKQSFMLENGSLIVMKGDDNNSIGNIQSPKRNA